VGRRRSSSGFTGLSIPKVLLSGEVESTGSRKGKFWAKDGTARCWFPN
jgi:hypothetical protein